ncbi:hypothetical protein ABIB15_001421 [Marisediminicola sp. UYEF4]
MNSVETVFEERLGLEGPAGPDYMQLDINVNGAGDPFALDRVTLHTALARRIPGSPSLGPDRPGIVCPCDSEQSGSSRAPGKSQSGTTPGLRELS